MILNLFFAYKLKERIYFVEQICNALDVEYTITNIDDVEDIVPVLLDNNAILFLDYSDCQLKSDTIIKAAVSNNYKAKLICSAKNDLELFRFIPASPVALIKSFDFENLLPDILKKLIMQMCKEQEEYLYFDILKGSVRILPDEFISLEGNILNLLNDESFQLSKRPQKLEHEDFMKINKNCIINLKNISSIESNTIFMNSGKCYQVDNILKNKLIKKYKMLK